MTTTKKLTADEFEALRPHLSNFAGKNIEAIRRILVDDVKQKDIAKVLNVSKEAVSAMVGQVWKTHLKHGLRPEGWEKVEAVLPKDYAEVVRNMEIIARKRVEQ